MCEHAQNAMPGSPQRLLPPRQRRRLAALRSAVGGAEAAASVAALYSSEMLERARAGLEPALLAEFACGSFPDALAQLHLAAEAIELPLAESALLEAEKNALTIPYLWSISTAGAEAPRRHPPPKSERTKETSINE